MLTRPAFARLVQRYMCHLALALLVALPAVAADKAAPSEYRLQPGDEITLSVLPRTEYGVSGTIPPDGILRLKNAGGVQAAGLTLAELEARAAEALAKVLRNPRVTVALVKLANPTRERITVIGAVGKAGPLEMEDGLRVHRAIALAGGPMPIADLRRVTIVHRDLSKEVVDLSDPEAAADPDRNPLLQEGDSVEVPARPMLNVTVVGGVPKPGPLQLTDEGMRLSHALGLAGGPQRDADVRKVVITHRDGKQTPVDLTAPGATERVLQDGDTVEVPFLSRPGFVSVRGQVAKPGTFEMQPGWTLEDVVAAGGNGTVIADLSRVELHRGGTKQVIDLETRLRQGKGEKIALEPGDEVIVPRHEQIVLLIGAVNNPGPRALKPGQRIKDFFTQEQAETLGALDGSRVALDKVQLIRKGEEARKINLKSVLTKKTSKDDRELQHGDIVFLPARDDPRRSPWDYLRALPGLGALFGLF